MFMKLTFAEDDREFWMRASDIRHIEKAKPGNKGEIKIGSFVATNMITPTGPVAYHVKESPSEIAEAAAQILRQAVEDDNKAKAHAIALARS